MPRPTQFGLRWLLLIMTLLCIPLAVYGGLMRGGRQRQVFLLFAIAAPMGLMILLGLYDQFVRRR